MGGPGLSWTEKWPSWSGKFRRKKKTKPKLVGFLQADLDQILPEWGSSASLPSCQVFAGKIEWRMKNNAKGNSGKKTTKSSPGGQAVGIVVWRAPEEPRGTASKSIPGGQRYSRDASSRGATRDGDESMPGGWAAGIATLLVLEEPQRTATKSIL